VYNWFKIFVSDFNLLSFEKFGQVDPVVLFLVQFETVIKLVHFDVFRVVALENFSEDPAV
jgi:hypothetical protein